MSPPEIDEGEEYIGYRDALNLIRSNTHPGGIENLPLESAVGYVAAEDIVALVDSPTSDISLKDGFAVKSDSLAGATTQHPVYLKIVGSVFAGSSFSGRILAGEAVKICSGSPIPTGADAVIAGEFCEETSSGVYAGASAENGRNIFHAGEDVKAGSIVLEKGKVFLPARLGLAAAAGIHHVKVYRKPRVALIAIGDEVIAPGQKLKEGQLYASNMVNLGAWLSSFGIHFETAIAIDGVEAIRNELTKALPRADVIMTSGGAWGSERDLIVSTLDSLGWQKLFRHVRIGPGKGIAFGLWQDKPVFCLPGGPPSNEMAFLQLALPGVLNMMGRVGRPLLTILARLSEDIEGRHRAWTEFRKARLFREEDGSYTVTPLMDTSRLKSIASAACLLCIPEGVKSLHRGQIVTVQVLVPAITDIPVTN